jgi:hypothetical protein
VKIRRKVLSIKDLLAPPHAHHILGIKMKNVNQQFASGRVAACSLGLLIAAFSLEVHAARFGTIDITLNGTAQGGVLSLSEIQPLGGGFVSVTTTQGESAEAVLNRLADEVCRSSSFGWVRPLQPRPDYLKVTGGNTLTLPFFLSQYGFSGSDPGFVSVKPVLSVSGSYDAEKNQVKLSWVNPSDQYDAIYIGEDPSTNIYPANTTNCLMTVYSKKWNIMAFLQIRGKRGDVYSPVASIVVSTNSQEELDTFPFYMGLAPNWSSWSDSTSADAVKCEQGLKTDVDLTVRGDPWDKPLYQIIKTTQAGMQGGVWRRFLGLKPGHTYKVEVRLNTLQMDACTNAWAFSFHAAYDNPDGSGLNVAQMAGQAALPDGSKGAEAGRVALYEPGVTTKGQWKKRSTDTPGSGLEIKNITLPKDVTSITVWLRVSGANSTGVGMDWIKLTDVTNNH